MAFLDRLKTAYAALGGKAAADSLAYRPSGYSFYSAGSGWVYQEIDDYASYARVYQSYVWVRKAVSIIAEAIAPHPVRVIDAEGKALSGHVVSALLANANDTMDPAYLWAVAFIHKLLGGEYFLEVVDDKRGQPRELWPRRPDYVRIEQDEARGAYPRAKAYEVQGLEDPLPAASVIHDRFYNPLSAWRGISPIGAVREGITIDLYAQAHAKGFYQNQARPDYAIEVEETLTPEERLRMEMQIAAKYGATGPSAYRPMLLEAGQKVQVLGFPPKDIQSLEDRRVSRDEVAAIFGIPDILMGFGADTYDTMEKREAAEGALWTLTLMPLVLRRDATLTHFFTTVRPLLRPGERVTTDLSGVAVLQEDLLPKLDLAGRLWSMGVPFNTIDAQLKLGVGAIPGGAVGFIAAGLMPVEEAALPTPPPAPVVPPAAPEAPSEAPPGGKAGRPAAKSRAQAQRTARALQRIRRQVAKRMEAAVEAHFAELADRVVARLHAGKTAVGRRNGHGAVITKDLPDVEALLHLSDDEPLYKVFRTYTLELLSASWETWNTALDLDIAFEQTDPAVVEALKRSGENVRGITETTREFLARTLQAGAEAGLTIDELAVGVRLVIEESYKNRARNVARTELATAQNTTTADRFGAAGVEHVIIFDGGGDDSDDICNQLNGTVQTLDWYRKNPLQHPNCVRAAGPYFSAE